MAKIRLRFGENEIEIESRDFYIDNDTAAQVIADLAVRLQENKARVVTDEELLEPPTALAQAYQANLDYLRTLRDAEIHEPEFTAPVEVSADEVPSKIEILERDAFFAKPRTVSETVERMRDYGWLASPLDVSKSLAKMAMHKELVKNSQENRTWYFKQEPIIS
ncbi:MAG: hypothetical protein WAO91_10560 [Candidatus Nitrosotenuis sp.]